ncbi:MAG: DUF4190 domain-containing protein [Nocardioides sp.]
MTTPQEPRDDDQPTMLPEAFLQQHPDGSTQPLPSQGQQGQDPYAQPQYGQADGQPGYPPQGYPQPGYGAYPPQGYGYAGPVQNHPSAQTAMVLGLVGLIGFFFCGVTVVVSPFAWRMGARARREIDASQGSLGGRDTATVGYVTGIIGTVILALAVVAIIAIIGLLAVSATSTTG